MEPRFPRRETGILLRRPLHACARVVAGGVGAVLEHLFRGEEVRLLHDVLGAECGDVHKVLPALERIVQHADLLPLIDKMRSGHESVEGGECLAALHAVLLAAVAGDDAGLIVIFEIIGVPSYAVQLVLPVAVHLLELAEVELRPEIAGHEAIRLHVLELEHHVELLILALGDIFEGVFGRHHGGFAELEGVIVLHHLSVFHKILVDVGAGRIVLHAAHDGDGETVGQPFALADVGDDILAETVHTHIQPELHHLFHFLADGGIVVIEIGLLHRKEV